MWTHLQGIFRRKAVGEAVGVAPRLAIGAVLLWMSASAFGQGNLGFLKHSPVAQFTPEDWELLRETAREVLNEDTRAASRSWDNPESGNHGSISVVKSGQAEDGSQCKVLRVDNFSGKLKGSAHYPVCQDAAGEWRLEEGFSPPAGAP